MNLKRQRENCCRNLRKSLHLGIRNFHSRAFLFVIVALRLAKKLLSTPQFRKQNRLLRRETWFKVCVFAIVAPLFAATDFPS
jgi:hypothetical protein